MCAAGAKGSRSFATSARRWAAAPTRAAHQAATKKLQTNPTTQPLEVPGEPGEGPEPVGPRMAGISTSSAAVDYFMPDCACVLPCLGQRTGCKDDPVINGVSQ